MSYKTVRKAYNKAIRKDRALKKRQLTAVNRQLKKNPNSNNLQVRRMLLKRDLKQRRKARKGGYGYFS